MFGHLPDELINKILSYNYVKPKYLMEMKLAGKLLNKCDDLLQRRDNTTEWEDDVTEFEEFLDYFPMYTQSFFQFKLDAGEMYDPIYVKERRLIARNRYNYVWLLPDPIAKLNDVFVLRFMT